MYGFLHIEKLRPERVNYLASELDSSGDADEINLLHHSTARSFTNSQTGGMRGTKEKGYNPDKDSDFIYPFH